MRVHTISFTGLDAPGGVPRFNRQLHQVLRDAGHIPFHWCWKDASRDLPGDCEAWMEQTKATFLSYFLSRSKLIDRDDVVIADGFWCGALSELGYRRLISVAHGIWGHRTLDDIDQGLQPENTILHEAQVQHRRLHLSRGLPIVAVSEFIAEQMRLQWDFRSVVVNNAIDPYDLGATEEDDDWWRQFEGSSMDRPVIVVHGVNDPGNTNKGWDHIVAAKEEIDRMGNRLRVVFGSLDEVHRTLGFKRKMNVLRHASLGVIPSGFEGNSYWALELLNSGVPVAAYDVGLFREMTSGTGGDYVGDGCWMYDDLGIVVRRSNRSPQTTAHMVRRMLTTGKVFLRDKVRENVQRFASHASFRDGWLKAVEDVCR